MTKKERVKEFLIGFVAFTGCSIGLWLLIHTFSKNWVLSTAITAGGIILLVLNGLYDVWRS